MRNKDNTNNDFIFNLSLSEIAFIIILALVLLLGWPLKEKIIENNELQVCKLLPDDPIVDPDRQETWLAPCDRCVANVREISLEEARNIREIGEATKIVFSEIKTKDEAKTKLNELIHKVRQNRILVQKIDNLEEENRVLKNNTTTTDAKNEIIRLTKEIKNLKHENLSLNKKNDTLQSAYTSILSSIANEKSKLVSQIDINKKLEKENNELKTSNERLNNRLAYGDIYPPCMQGMTRKKNGEIDRWDSLFRVYMREKDVVVRLSNPDTLNHPSLDNRIRKIISDLDNLSRTRLVTWEEFDKFSRNIDQWASERQPRCRMVVLMYNRIKDAADADEKRLRYIENNYYKEEMSRRVLITIPEPEGNQHELISETDSQITNIIGTNSTR